MYQKRGFCIKNVEFCRSPAPVVDPFSRKLMVSVLECKDLKKMDIIGKNDVFCRINVDAEEVTSSTVVDGGAAPRWHGGAGEVMLFTPLVDPTTLQVTVFDKVR